MRAVQVLCRQHRPVRRLLDGPAAAGDDPGLPPYKDVSRKLILAFKHGDGLQLTPFLKSLMARDFAMMMDGEDILVVPVPFNRQRYFRRRYN
uniref:Uncharacterized protein n=1 Tax=uncultured alpha proteobacterium HF0070_17D04 TaxID=710805 RepID=E0XS82_9PROT|nr:hypothetical protein [uncultured alpha proteobacterium HF0070_17D04]